MFLSRKAGECKPRSAIITLLRAVFPSVFRKVFANHISSVITCCSGRVMSVRLPISPTDRCAVVGRQLSCQHYAREQGSATIRDGSHYMDNNFTLPTSESDNWLTVSLVAYDWFIHVDIMFWYLGVLISSSEASSPTVHANVTAFLALYFRLLDTRHIRLPRVSINERYHNIELMNCLNQ